MVRTIQASREIKQDFWEMNKRGSKQAQSKLHSETFLCSCCLQQWRVLRGDVALARLQLSRAPQLETELHNPPSVGSSPHTATQQAWSPLRPEDVFVQLFCGPLFETNGVACNFECNWTLGWERCPWCWPSVIHDWLIESFERWH